MFPNLKTQFVKLLLTTNKQDEWEKFLNSLLKAKPKIQFTNSINPYLTKNVLLLDFRPQQPSLKVAEKIWRFRKLTRKSIFTKSGNDILEVTANIQNLKNLSINNYNIYTIPSAIEKMISKESLEIKILKFLPKNIILILTKIINGCFIICYFPKTWKQVFIISIHKPSQNHELLES